MSADDLYLSFMFMLIVFSHAISTTPANRLLGNNNTILNSTSTSNTTTSGNFSITDTSIKNPLNQGKEILHNAFASMDRGTVVRGTIVLAGITCLVLMYIGVKTLVLRKTRKPKRYTLITDPTSIEEPLFNEQNDEEEEIEDDTLFVRK